MHGLSTLNRLLGKKNKEVSRSTTNLSKASSTLDTSSQHNKISPIVNGPFEQTFRVTVYLPKNQLYVERIGAKTKLRKLLDTICESKHLNADKYELRHPGDSSQAFDNEKTIGEVGLNELRLMLKTESRFNGFHSNDMMRYKSESVSSSEVSRNSKNVLRKTSPYSSTNSLNSLDSTGMNLTGKMQPPVAPARKKRAAPRPPSQNSIPEQEMFSSTLNVFKDHSISILPRKNFHVSSPQLFNNSNITTHDANRSDKNNNNIDISTSQRLNAITRPISMFTAASTTELDQKSSFDRQRTTSESSEIQDFMGKQSSNSLEKKKKMAPVPPKRVHRPVPSPRTIQEELRPQIITDIKEIDESEGTSKEIVVEIHQESPQSQPSTNVSKVMLNNTSQPSPSEDNQPSSIGSDGSISIQIVSSERKNDEPKEAPENQKLPIVSKIHIQPNETEERTSSDDDMTVNIYNVTKSFVKLEKQYVNEEIQSETKVIVEAKEIKKPVSPVAKAKATVQKSVSPEPISSIQKSVSTVHKSPETEINQYSVQKSVEIKQVSVQKSPEPEIKKIEVLKSPEVEIKKIIQKSPEVEIKKIIVQKSPEVEIKKNVAQKSPELEIKKIIVQKSPEPEIDQRPQSPLWTYTLPAPPVFADSSVVDKISPTDQQKSDGKYFNDFVSTIDNETVISDSNTTIVSAETHIEPIIRERKSLDDSFTILSPLDSPNAAVDDTSEKSTIEVITSDVEDGYLGNGNIVKVTSSDVGESDRMEKEIIVDDFRRSRLIITRSDSFHSIGQPPRNATKMNMSYSAFSASPQRSLSYLSLVQAQKAEILMNKSTAAEVPYSRQKSNSELSISDTPSLQSLEVIKNILNSSRKNSLQDSPPIAEDVPSAPKFKPEPIVERMKKIEEPETPKPAPVAEKKPEVQYRYQGPPKINLTTWNERPKIEVSIKSDSDYKFGGSSATLPRDFRKLETSKRHTIHIQSNDEPDHHLPKVLGVEYKKDVHQTENKSKTIINIRPRPVSLDVVNDIPKPVTVTSSPSPTYTSQSIAFNRLSSNNKYSPVVHGFKLGDIKENEHKSLPTDQHESPQAVTVPHVPEKTSFLRSTSAGDINKRMTFSTVVEQVKTPNNDPFKVQLRKTGLKEKILHNDEKTESIFGRVIETKPNPHNRYTINDTMTADKIDRKFINRSNSQPQPPPPPPKPTVIYRKSAPIEVETRDQLFDAIKNFNKDCLRKK